MILPVCHKVRDAEHMKHARWLEVYTETFNLNSSIFSVYQKKIRWLLWTHPLITFPFQVEFKWKGDLLKARDEGKDTRSQGMWMGWNSWRLRLWRADLRDISLIQAYLRDCGLILEGSKASIAIKPVIPLCWWWVLLSIRKNATSGKCSKARHDNLKYACTPFRMFNCVPKK